MLETLPPCLCAHPRQRLRDLISHLSQSSPHLSFYSDQAPECDNNFLPITGHIQNVTADKVNIYANSVAAVCVCIKCKGCKYDV